MAGPRRPQPTFALALAACLGLGIAIYVQQESGNQSVAVSPQVPQPRPTPAAQQERRIDFALLPKLPSQQRLDHGVVHVYSIDLREGQILDAAVDQNPVANQKVDVLIRVRGPDGVRPDIDDPKGSSGTEDVLLLARATGRYQLEIHGEGGIYRIRLRQIRTATPTDRLNAQAFELFYHARAIIRKARLDYSKAVKEFLEAENLWRRVNNHKRQAMAAERVSYAWREYGNGNWQENLAVTTRAYELYRSISEHQSEAKMLVWRGLAFRNLGEMELAESDYRQAFQLASDEGFQGEEAEALMNLGVLLNQLGRKAEALEAYERSLELWKREHRKEYQVYVLNSMGQLHASLGQYDSSEGFYRQAWEILKREPLSEFHPLILTSLAEVSRKKGKTDQALFYVRQALGLFKKMGLPNKEAAALTEMTLIYKGKGDLRRARNFQEQALAIYRRTADRRSEATARFNLGLLLLDQKNFSEATRQFERASELSFGQTFLEGEVMALYGAALTEKLRGNPRAARATAEKALKVIESMPRDLPYEGLDPSSESPYLIARVSTYQLLLDLLVKSPVGYTSAEDKARAFEVSESARWRTLLDSLSSSRLRPGLLQQAAPELAAEYIATKELVDKTERKRRWQARQGLSDEELLRTERKLMEKLRTLDARIKASWVAASEVAAPISLRETQGLLDSDTILLEYSLGKSRSLLWLVSPSSVEVFELPGRDKIEKQALRLYELLAEGQNRENGEMAASLAARLSDTLLGPVANRLEKKRLAIVPDGAIPYVPFAALPEPAGAGKGGQRSMLLAKHTIIYEPSASVLSAIRAEISHRHTPSGFAAIGNPQFSGDYPPLPYSGDEVRNISAMVPAGERKLVKLGYEATRDLVLSSSFRGFGFYHFATHGQNHPEQPELSEIILSQVDRQGQKRNGDLRLQDIKNLDLPSDLVVLSACKTAIGKEMQGEGFIGLPQGFMYAGAARVVVSLWNVNDASTPELMAKFYQGIFKQRLSPSEALRVAQLWMAEREKWSSPFYWGGFELHGEWR